MLAPVFHAWERYLASVSKDRVVRPFEWGLDWIGSSGGAQDDPPGQIARWVDEVMRDSDAFYRVDPTSDFEFTQAPDELRAGGEAGTLRFPSPMATPHPENNVVVARWFPASGEAPVGSAPVEGADGARGRAVVVMSQWNADSEGHVGLAKVLARFGVSALRLSLPYHDRRMPPELTRADYIVSSNVARTVQVCRQAVLDARRAIDWLALQGFERIGILGTSLGSCLALLTTAHEPRIRAQALNHVSPWFADVVWRGLSTRHVRAGLDGHIDLDGLRSLWRPISPFEYLDRLGDRRSLLVYARYDLTFPVDLSRVLIDEFARRDLPHRAFALPCGHYSTGSAPFKFLDAYVLTKFLRQSL